MSGYNELKNAIRRVVKTNNNREITGQNLQSTLTSMVNSLGANYHFAGFASLDTNPGTPDQNIFYIASEEGTYVNFSGINLAPGLSFLMWNGKWSSETISVGEVTKSWVQQNYVSIAFFNELFELYNDSTKIAVNDTIPVDKTKLNIKAMFGFWTEQYISALGKNDSGGSGSGVDMATVWSALAGSTDEQINESHLTTALSEYATMSWVSQIFATITSIPTKLSQLANDTGFITSSALPTKISQLTNDTGFITSAALPTKVSQLVNDAGYVTASIVNGYATQSWVSNNYLPLIGGTLTGNLNLGSNTLFAGNICLINETENWNFPLAENRIRLLSCIGAPIGAPGKWFSGVSFITQYVGFQLVTFGGGDDNLRFRRLQDNNVWHDWYNIYHEGFKPTKSDVGLGNVDNTADANKSVLYATTAGSATKLQTARTIWGNTFDGTRDVAGDLILPNGKKIVIGTASLSWDADNNAVKIDGNVYATGGVSALGKNDSGGSGSGVDMATVWSALAGSTDEQINESHLTTALSEYATMSWVSQIFATITSIPTKLSQLANDTGFITSSALPTKISQLTNDTGFITSAALPTKVSQLVNDAGYVTASIVNGYATQSWVSNNYLPLIGGTLTGNLNLGSNTLFAGNICLINETENWNFPLAENRIRLLSCIGAPIGAPGKWFSGVSFITQYVGFQLVTFGGGDDNLRFRRLQDNNVWHDWYNIYHEGFKPTKSDVGLGNVDNTADANKSVLYATTAGSATKLQTARTIWGQSFDGTSNVDGNLSCNGQGSFNSLQIGNITIIYDAANKGLRIAGGGLYTDSYLSSLGVDASTALSVKKWADSINLTEESDAELATAYSIGNLYRMINSNQTSITQSLNQSVGALQGRCTSLEQRVSALENKVN